MLRDDVGLKKKDMQTTRSDLGSATAVASDMSGRLHLLESEMRSLRKKIADDEAARDKAAADKSLPVMPVGAVDCRPEMTAAMLTNHACKQPHHDYRFRAM